MGVDVQSLKALAVAFATLGPALGIGLAALGYMGGLFRNPDQELRVSAFLNLLVVIAFLEGLALGAIVFIAFVI